MKATPHNRRTLAAGLALLAGSGSAFAHHPMGGETPSTLWQGLLSGLGHPIIGVDHLAFIVAIGLLCAFVRMRSPGLPLALVAATVLGAALQWGGFTLPYLEVVVAASVVAAGLLLFRAPTRLKTAGLAGALAAVCHGLAYGEAIIGAEPAPLGAYLVGFSLIQMLIAGFAFVAGRAALHHGPWVFRTTRNLSAGVVGGIGVLALFTALLA
jgi:urease accessory protein